LKIDQELQTKEGSQTLTLRFDLSILSTFDPRFCLLPFYFLLSPAGLQSSISILEGVACKAQELRAASPPRVVGRYELFQQNQPSKLDLSLFAELSFRRVRLLLLDSSTDPQLVFLDNGKVSTEINLAQPVEPFCKN
jgi:hypothetical protein